MSNFSLTVAAFDFDNTITNRDSLLPFLIYTQGAIKTYAKMALLLPYFIGFLIHVVPRQRVKEKIAERFFKGLPLAVLQAIGRQYAEERLDQLVKPEAIRRLRWHQQQGHRCVLVSAALDIYLNDWAKRHGFNDVICSHLEVNSHGQVTGRLKGKNCWGPEKKRRLDALLGSKHYQLYAYGDSRGDEELLKMADYSFYKRFA